MLPCSLPHRPQRMQTWVSSLWVPAHSPWGQSEPCSTWSIACHPPWGKLSYARAPHLSSFHIDITASFNNSLQAWALRSVSQIQHFSQSHQDSNSRCWSLWRIKSTLGQQVTCLPVNCFILSCFVSKKQKANSNVPTRAGQDDRTMGKRSKSSQRSQPLKIRNIYSGQQGSGGLKIKSRLLTLQFYQLTITICVFFLVGMNLSGVFQEK